MSKKYPKVDRKKCTGCGSCAAVCSASPNVFEMEGDKVKVVNPEACTECNSCLDVCPTKAVTIVSSKKEK
ncbi:4Fe-4S ferredoxin [bacterium (Candidatus Torokbacteria) CG_4_10_14_0_2_um_filter_35_8]|nr:MAG: 4Fe-4S ferredoxin [bacterium (Candidatus Torokbacteria) CG_4_10_14_0_2_um_filter_35_8]